MVNRPNHHEFDDEQSKMQVNKEIEECVSCESRCNTHCPHKKNTGELYCPSKGKYSKGNAQKHNSKMGRILDGLPMSLGQTQHEQIWHLHYNREQKMVGSMKAKFTGIADMANGEF